MSNCRVSPRVAIQSWLRETQTSSKRKCGTLEADTRLVSPQRYNNRYQNHDEGRNERQTKHPNNSMSLAKRLGLHAPFLAFPEATNATHDNDVQNRRPQKPRKLALSSDSFIDEAQRRIPDPKFEGEFPLPPPQGLELSNTMRLASISPTKYKRRKRHKIREDRYDLKFPKSRKSEKEKDGITPSESKRPLHRGKRRVRNALIYNYSAGNVAQDRLTVSDHHFIMQLEYLAYGFLR